MRILVVGDAIVDRTLQGSVERVNPEAPGTVFRVERTEDRNGGAAAVAMLCESLGAEVETAFGEPRCIKQRCVADGRLLHDRIDFDVPCEPIHFATDGPIDCVVVADYGKGAVGADLVSRLRRHFPGVPIVVDPARGESWTRYAGATVIKCNHNEYDGGPLRDAEHLVVTYGAKGMRCDNQWLDGRSACLVDVTGAGDTVAAGEIQVSRLGVAPITWDEIEPRRRVVVANGCFDLLHAGHVAMLEFAKAQGDWLSVLVNSDASVRRLKGPSRPIVPQDQRVAMLQALRCVDYVQLFDADSPAELLCQISPDVLVKGAGSKPTDGQEFARRVVFAPLVDGISTTISLARATHQA